jgi:uncharacterized protein (TIGR00645 family)
MNFLEQILWQSRWIVLPAVFASISAAVALVVLGTYQIWGALQKTWYLFSGGGGKNLDKDIIVQIVSAVDTYLIATVLLIFGVGIYELFIGKISATESEATSKILMVKSLDQLKDKLVGVIIIVLIVTFFKEAVALSYGDIASLLWLSVGIFLVALAVKLIGK